MHAINSKCHKIWGPVCRPRSSSASSQIWSSSALEVTAGIATGAPLCLTLWFRVPFSLYFTHHFRAQAATAERQLYCAPTHATKTWRLLQLSWHLKGWHSAHICTRYDALLIGSLNFNHYIFKISGGKSQVLFLKHITRKKLGFSRNHFSIQTSLDYIYKWISTKHKLQSSKKSSSVVGHSIFYLHQHKSSKYG